MNTLSIEEQNLLQSELLPGESITWSAKPNPGVVFHASDWYMIPFSLLWGGFSIFWELGVTGHGAFKDSHPSWYMMLWGIPFVVIGQYYIWGRFLYVAWKKRRILYAITDRRVFVLVRPPQAKLISAYIEDIPTIEKAIRPDDNGTLTFGTVPSFWANEGQRSASIDGLFLNTGIPVFVDINDAASVFSIVSAVRERSRTSDFRQRARS